MKSFITAVHPRADGVSLFPLLRFVERQGVDALILFGDVTGPVLSDRERVLYRQACELLAETTDLTERARTAKALLARPGLAEPFRDALRFYLSHVVDTDAQGQAAWQEAYRRAAKRLADFAARLKPYPCAVLADSAMCEEAFGDHLLDFESLAFGEKILKGVGLAPRDGIHPAVEHTPAEYRQDLRRAVPLGAYLAEFDILVANALVPPIESAIERLANRLVILPGESPDVTGFERIMIAFEPAGTFSHYEFQDDRIIRHVHQPAGERLRLVRQDTFDSDFRLLRTKTDFDSSAAARPVARADGAAAGAPGRRRLADLLAESRQEPADTGDRKKRKLLRYARPAAGGAVWRFLTTPIPELIRLPRAGGKPEFMEIPIGRIRDNPDPLREHLDEAELARLAQSIREFGVIVPIIVKRVSGGAYQVVAGQRRLTAARIAGLSAIPAVVRALDERASAEVCYIENLHRVDLKPVEDAEAFERLVWELHDFTKGQLARRLGLTPDEIRIHEEILRMPVILREAMSMGLLDLERSRLLATIPGEEERLALLRRAVRGNLPLAELQAAAARAVPRADAPPGTASGG